MTSFDSAGPEGSARARTYEVIFGHDTPAGKAFDVLLIVAIVASIATVMLDSVESWQAERAGLLSKGSIPEADLQKIVDMGRFAADFIASANQIPQNDPKAA